MFANINGVKLFFDITGKQFVPDGPRMREKPICFVVHGGPGGDHTHYLPQFLELEDTMQMVFIDHRGCGRSGECPIETCSMVQNAEDVEKLRTYLGVEKMFLLGLSYGGMVAQTYAMKYGENLHGLMLLSTAPSHRCFDTLPREMEKRATPEQKQILEKQLFGGGDSTDEVYNDYFKMMGSLYHYHYDETAYMEKVSRSIGNRKILQYQQEHDLGSFDYTPELHRICVPTLVMCGKEDFITPPEHSREIAAAVKGAKLHVIEEASHEIGADRPDYVFPVIREFVEENFGA